MKKLLLKVALLILFAAPFISRAQFDGFPYPCPNFPNDKNYISVPSATWIAFCACNCGVEGVAYQNSQGDSSKNTYPNANGSNVDVNRPQMSGDGPGLSEAYYDNTTAATCNVAWSGVGEWSKYTLNFTQTGVYVMDLNFEFCCGLQNGTIGGILAYIKKDGEADNKFVKMHNDTLHFENQNGSDMWDTTTFSNLTYNVPSAGKYCIKIVNATGGLNFSGFTLYQSNGINDLEKVNFKIYPNPVKETLNVTLPNSINSNITITDVTGKEVYNADRNGKSIDINTAALTKGMYFITIKNSQGTLTKKFMKQ